MIPPKICNTSALKSIDFSINQLSGEIPPSMSSLSFLCYLNFSSNNLTGTIPTGTQLQSFTASSYAAKSMKYSTRQELQRKLCKPYRWKHEQQETWPWSWLVLRDGTRVYWILGCQRFFYFRFLDNMWYKLHDGVCKYCCLNLKA